MSLQMRTLRSRVVAVLGIAGLGGAVLACEPGPTPPNEVTVVGSDYAFRAPDTLPPGPTAFRFENAGQLPHEMILVRLKQGVTLDSALAVAQAGGDPWGVTEGGLAILIAAPGASADTRALVDLEPGHTYGVICTFRDTPEAPPHTALGMHRRIYISPQ